MSKAFNPYHVWLGISPEQQPPNHYRLLGIGLFENDQDVIASAARKQTTHLRTFRTGKHAALAQTLMKEVAVALMTLSSPDKKHGYDVLLQDELKAADRQGAGVVFGDGVSSSGFSARATRSNGTGKRSFAFWAMITLGTALLAGTLLAYVFLGRHSSQVAQEVWPPTVQQEERLPQQANDKTAPDALKSSLAAPETPAKQPKAEKPTPPMPVEKVPEPAPQPLQEHKTKGGPSEEPPKTRAPNELPEPSTVEPPSNEDKRLPVPEGVTQERATKLVQDTYKEEYEKAQTPALKQSLAKLLLQQALGMNEDPAGRFGLLSAALDMATAAGDGTAAFEIADRTAELYRVNSFAMKERVLAQFAETASTLGSHRGLADKAFVLMEEALAENSLNAAGKLGKLALSEANKAREKELAQQVRNRMKEVDRAVKAFAEVEVATTTLREQPDNPEANTSVGRYTCCVKGDWNAGLPMLAKGGDAVLKNLATMELRRPTKTEDQLALADGWYDLINSEGPNAKIQLQLHTADWYSLVAPSLTGLDRAKVEKRLRSLNPVLAKQRVHKPTDDTAGSDSPPPPSATVPAVPRLDRTRARQGQEACARALHLPMTLTNSIGMKLVLVPPGEFDMGSSPKEVDHYRREQKARGIFEKKVQSSIDAMLDSEGPRHRVKITKPFYLGIYEVTQSQWVAVEGKNRSYFVSATFDEDPGARPVEKPSWNEAVEFCRKLSEMPDEAAAKRVYRLPTEAEWEYACRAGSTSSYYFGDDETNLGNYGWFEANSDQRPHPVGLKKPNAWGLYDMCGNVKEWCADCWGWDYYKRSPPRDPQGPPPNPFHILRGGSWRTPGFVCRSAYRENYNGNSYDMGFRVCLVSSHK